MTRNNKKLDAALGKRDQIYNQLKRFKSFLNNLNHNSSEIIMITKRLEKVETLWDEYNTCQFEIESINQNESDNEQNRVEFEETYFNLTCNAQNIIDNLNKQNKIKCPSVSYVQPSTSSHDNIKLPDFNLPSFNGSYTDYMEFHDNFVSLIHENQKLTNAQKLQYLKSCLQGEAAKCIQSYKITDDNYIIAWQTIKDTFEHRRLITEQHIKILFDIPVITKSNSDNLKHFTFTLVNQIGCLKSLGLQVDTWNPLLIHLLINKLDPNTKLAWEQMVETHDHKYLPSVDELIKFLRTRSQTMQKVFSQNNTQNQTNNKPNYNIKNYHKTTTHVANSYRHKCAHCQDHSHFIYACRKFLDLSQQERFNEVKKKNLCSNCLRSNHTKQDCVAQPCKFCNKKHNTLLCFAKPSHLDQSSSKSSNSASQESVETNKTIATLSSNLVNSNHLVILSTSLVIIYDINNKPITCRALLDSGSQSNFMTSELAKRLNLKTFKTNMSIMGINQVTSNALCCTKAKIHSRHNNYSKDLPFLVIENITSHQPPRSFSDAILDIPKNINLADPYFNKSNQIDLLLGVSIFYELLCVGQIKLSKNQPILQKTHLGWVISGSVPIQDENQLTCLLITSENNLLQNQLKQFWELEDNLENSIAKFNKDEIHCLNHFEKTHSRENSGKIQVSLPLKENQYLLLNNFKNAEKRFFSIEHKLQRDSKLRTAYTNFMREYESLNHMTKLNQSEINNGNLKYYLPHHCVFKKSTDKIRVVFDASSRDENGLSLNDICYVGPTLQSDLFSIIIRFRKHNYVLKADIIKMYRQITVQPSQRDLQRILWRENPNEDLNHYILNTVTYGTAPAAFLSIRSLQQTAYDKKDQFPEACHVIMSDFYVDDLCTGAETISKLTKLKKDIQTVLESGTFVLSQWMSNEPSILRGLEQNLDQSYYISDNQTVKTLGITWTPSQDNFQYSVNLDVKNKPITKRMILSIISQIFDPLGLISPIIIKSKIILQELWKLKLGWDESVPLSTNTEFLSLIDNLKQVNEIKIPRHALLKNPIDIQIHGFSDASEVAYGAAVYIRSVDQLGNISINLLCAKSKVAPLQTISLPRLELCGALVLSRLISKVIKSLNLKLNNIFLWTDSQIVLAWLSQEPSNWKTFIANRVSEIQTHTQNCLWHHVSSENNPADLISRSCETMKLINTNMWWYGPDFLYSTSQHWPLNSINDFVDFAAPENKKQKISSNICSVDTSIFDRFSSYTKLIRVISYCFRFAKNSRLPKNERTTENLKLSEIEITTKCLIKLTQSMAFGKEIHNLSKQGFVEKGSKLANLNPFLDENKIIRVGGRLSYSNLSVDKKFPIVLPNNHIFTKLIVQHEHLKTYHGGVQIVLSSLRQKYWPLNAKNLIKGVIRNCLICFRTNPKELQQLMGNLPKSRLLQAPPFSSCGIDFAGPFLVKDGTLRNSKSVKVYICLFICFLTKAVHIETAGDLSSETFLNAFKRFIARRGICKNVYTDNGTNFVGANNILKQELKIFMKLSQNKSVQSFLTENEISWHFIPPRAPNFGGLWESSIKIAKRHFVRIVGNSNLTYERFSTVITQIEGILNSRPLCPLSDDPNDLQALTPGHFLIGQPLNMLPEIDVTSLPENRLSHYKRTLQMVQHFWSRWTSEYLSSLQTRNKWMFKDNCGPQLNDLVIIKEDNLPPLLWKLGRIIELHPGQDGLVRVLTLKTADGLLKRGINKLCLVPKPEQ